VWKLLLGAIVLLGSPLVGTFVGGAVGEGLCRDDEYAILRCMDETLGGAAIGAVVGLVVGVMLVVIALQRSH
jgi:hypothetical protein